MQAFCTLIQQPLSLALLANVSSNFRRANYSAVSTFDWRNCQRDLDKAPILALPHSLVVFNSFTTADARQDPNFFIDMVCGYQHRNRLSYDLRGRIAEDAFRALIPTSDDSLKCFADDCIVRGFDNGGEPERSELRTLQVSNQIRETLRIWHCVGR